MILGDGNLGSKLSTGNKLIDALGGGIYGLANATQPKGQYVPMFNWRGNGLAYGGLEFIADPRYKNMYDAAQATSAVLNNQGNGNDNNRQEDSSYGSDQLFNTLGRLSTMGGKVGEWAANQRGRLLPNGKLMFGNMFKNLGDFTNQNQRVIPISRDTIV
jgi:hypothetical protein